MNSINQNTIKKDYILNRTLNNSNPQKNVKTSAFLSQKKESFLQPLFYVENFICKTQSICNILKIYNIFK